MRWMSRNPHRWSSCSAARRASVRDTEWLTNARQERKCERKAQRGKTSRLTWTSSDDGTRALAALSQAIDSILAEEQETRPKTISLRRLMNRTGLSANVARRVIRCDSAMAERLNALAKDLRRRIVDWAYHALLKEGKRITVSSILERSKLDWAAELLPQRKSLVAKYLLASKSLTKQRTD